MQLFKQLFKYYLYMIFIFFIGRIGLFILYFDKFKDSGVDYWLTFLYGLRMDTITASIFLIIPLLLLSFSPNSFKNIVNRLLKYYFLVILAFIIYIENATFPFIAEYDVRPNYLFVEYLDYPREVFSMIFDAYKLELFIAFLMILSFIYGYLKLMKNDFIKVFETNYLIRIILFIPLVFILFMGIRSSFGHRPANVSDAMFSTNRMVNEITKNSIHSILYAIYVNKEHDAKDIQKQYGKMQIQEALQRVKKRLNIQSSNDESPLSRLEKSNFKSKKPKNLVIFLQESLGYQFVEAVGGEEGITPNLNKLSKEGILFKNLYSTGTRSVRGIAGDVAGNYAVPGRGIVKRNKAQNDFFTFASMLKPFGYHTSFIYGGESRFDNMRSWFIGNGFDNIIDQPDFKNPSYVSSWGVCDEDLVIRANEEFKKLYASNQKFATIMFSQSNHSPFNYPSDKIKLLEGVPRKSVKNAVKYADYAIGRFIEMAKKEDYYKDTIFVIVADHNNIVVGLDMVPVDRFHIPALILGSDIKPMSYEHISSQPDVLATALDLLGLDLTYPIMGHSIFSDKKQDIALMKFHNAYALRVKDKVVVLRPNKKALTFSYHGPKKYVPFGKYQKQIAHDEELEKDALAFVITLNYLYNNKLYK